MTDQATGSGPNEGWQRPGQARKWHYFRDGTALCNRWAWLGRAPLDQDTPGFGKGPNDCAACWRKREAEVN